MTASGSRVPPASWHAHRLMSDEDGAVGAGGLVGQEARKSIKELLGKEMWFEEKVQPIVGFSV